MKIPTSRRQFLALLASAFGWMLASGNAQENPDGPRKKRGPGAGGRRDAADYVLPPELAAYSWLSLVLGRVTDQSVTVSLLARESISGYFEYGEQLGRYTKKTNLVNITANQPVETVFSGLRPNTGYHYRLQYRKEGDTAFQARPECRFQTQRPAGEPFLFAIQGDSHPERPQMSEPNLYARTLQKVAEAKPDFYICMGDDFSVAPIRDVNFESVAERYTLQRPFLGLVAESAPLFLLNGNHEQASLFNYQQTDERHQVAVLAQKARNQFYPIPAPDRFYSGDSEPLEDVGLRKDYCSWTWGDALFVVLDNYWHSPAQVDSGFHEEKNRDEIGGRPGGNQRDWWAITMGDRQYQWFKETLEKNRAKHKFVFAHHVLGTGRGGVDVCDLYEWGGLNKRGESEFAAQRPGWELPVHQLMVKHGVTIFFQGHDHLFCKQERDGIIYQEVPMPADQGYMAYNDDRYQSGVKLPNSGHLRVAVSPEEVKVEYVRTYLVADEGEGKKTGDIAHTYTVRARS